MPLRVSLIRLKYFSGLKYISTTTMSIQEILHFTIPYWYSANSGSSYYNTKSCIKLYTHLPVWSTTFHILFPQTCLATPPLETTISWDSHKVSVPTVHPLLYNQYRLRLCRRKYNYRLENENWPNVIN